jgi:hypothetical protein
MKKLLSIILLAITTQASAFEFTITDICENKLVLNENIEILNDVSAGDLTLYMFKQYEIPYIGNIDSISSIFNTKTGLDSYEVIFGWCYEIDGVQPDVFMSQVTIDPTVHKKMNWFYGYAHYKEGEWLTYCTPVYEDKNEFICK